MNQEEELKKLKDKNQELPNLYELEINGYIIRSKTEYIEGGEKNTKYIANLERKRSEAKTLHKIEKQGHTISDQSAF